MYIPTLLYSTLPTYVGCQHATIISNSPAVAQAEERTEPDEHLLSLCIKANL